MMNTLLHKPVPYVYDNSIDNEDARLLFRLKEGKLAKKYVEEIPRWALPMYQG